MQTEEQTLPQTFGHWPPVAHIIRNEDKPAKEGTIALCGEKLMGIDLRDDVRKATCDKCCEIMIQELRGKQQ